MRNGISASAAEHVDPAGRDEVGPEREEHERERRRRAARAFEPTPRRRRHTPNAPNGIANTSVARGRTPMRPNTKVPKNPSTP